MPIPLIETLASRLTPASKVLLYLSSGAYQPEFQDLPFDWMIAADRVHRDNGLDGKVLKLAFDNNAVLRLLLLHQIRIDCVLAVNDGCVEGGNEGCAYRGSALGRLLPILQDESLWITDHSSGWRRWGFSIQDGILPDGFPANLASHRHHDLKTLLLRRDQRPSIELGSGSTRIRVTHDSACGHLSNLDVLLVPERLSGAIGFWSYFHPFRASTTDPSVDCQEPVAPELVVMGSRPIQSILQVAKELDARGVKRLGVLPSFGQFSQSVVEELLEHEFCCIESIEFFYLKRGDFAWTRC
jgi:hypothetical protein